MRQEQMLRHWKILRRLEQMRQGMTPKELAFEFKTSVRTIYRDLITLQDAGFPVSSDRTEKGTVYFLTQSAGAISHLCFGPSELLALYLSQGILSQLRGTVFHDAIEQLLAKVDEVVPQSAREYFRELESYILVEIFTRRNYQKKARQIQAILACLRDKTVLKMEYFSPNRGELEREVDPYHLWIFGDSFYLIGFCHLNQEIRTFLVDRIKKALPTKKPFEMKSDFDFRKYSSESFRVMRSGKAEEYELKFAPQISYLIKERIWHPSQTIHNHPDGSLTLRFCARGMEEVKSWVMSFGEMVDVLKPENLREEIKNSCRKILERG